MVQTSNGWDVSDRGQKGEKTTIKRPKRVVVGVYLPDAVAGWEFVSVEQVHEFFKAQMTADKVVNKHTGEIIEFPGSTATMDTVTFSTYCEKLREYGREFLNVEIPDPDKYWKCDEKNTQLGGFGTYPTSASAD